MQSGRVYKVDSVDSVDTQLWLSGDDVLICGDVVINKDEQGEKASVTLLHRPASEKELYEARLSYWGHNGRISWDWRASTCRRVLEP
jgi:hypothetical protein